MTDRVYQMRREIADAQAALAHALRIGDMDTAKRHAAAIAKLDVEISKQKNR